MSHFILLENGTIWFHRPGGAPLHDDYQWYRLEGEEYQEMYTFSRYDGDGYEENGEGDLYLYNHEEIEKEKWEEWMSLNRELSNGQQKIFDNQYSNMYTDFIR
ncbi:MAG: hypothetical protein NC089_13015, partial [Bacteroides sp.]|nr:hypothetical protein [Bacteroides sp.]